MITDHFDDVGLGGAGQTGRLIYTLRNVMKTSRAAWAAANSLTMIRLFAKASGKSPRDLRLVALAVLLAFASSYTALDLMSRAPFAGQCVSIPMRFSSTTRTGPLGQARDCRATLSW